MKLTFLVGSVALLAGTITSPLTLPATAQGLARGSVTWSGNVDNTAIVVVHGTDVQTHTVSGKSVSDVSIQANGSLPHRPVRVFLRDWHGRGDVVVIQQPRPANDFTAEVRVHDPQGGSSRYRFTLAWRPGIFGGRFGRPMRPRFGY